ncbi:MAG: outer membrane protein transport protein [Deltaproteobacteria bacterium]|nr:outer membrane protein transport protein [Deltaproteobacteria bacterium]MBW1951890.1 outer membrane protein transport protein [Deltaproteobacteria bacterium]MBW1986968.1 outer membrane protein transport protein [Deltaproteobacteria bacterium]MBW2134483.1 outer membrane protein transport protein [Deltaproteobacteria bacterium]
MPRIGLVLIAVMFFWFVSNPSAYGAGFALVQQGTAAMAQGNAFVAEANDASAIFYNPAGLNQLKRPQIYLGTIFNYPDREFHGPDGQFAQTNHRLFHAGTAYVAIPFTDRVAAGVGFFAPFGLGTPWPPEWTGRYLTTFSELKTYNLNPVISVKPIESLSVAMGFNVLWSSVKLKRKVQLPFPLPDAETTLDGDGTGYGYNLGVLYEPVTGLKLGVAYRSEISLRYKGQLKTTLPAFIPAVPDIPGSANLTFPPSVTAGISFSRFKPFSFEFDATWTGWSTYDQLEIRLNRPTVVNGVLTDRVVVPKNWKDVWAFRFGANYELKNGMKLRVGYIYDLNPVPDDTLDPQVPDADRHIFTVGGDLKIKQFTLGIAYNYLLFESRNKNNNLTLNGVPLPVQANGRYESQVHSLGLSMAYQF